LISGRLVWRNHRCAAKKRARAIEYARDRLKRVSLYRELIKLTRATLAYADQAATQLWQASDPIAATLWQAEFRHYHPLIERIVAQTERRVLHGEAIAANEKIVSLFEPHADIIVKGGREVQYGHKLNLTTGRSGLILDLVIEPGNPADSERFLPMLKRHIAFYGEAPRQTAADGGFASRDNLSQAKALGVHDAAFHKKAGPWIPEPSATGLREADLNVLAKLGEQGLEWRLEAEAFARREVCGEDDLLDFLFGHSVDIQVTRQPST